jgi:hypothetical protein
MRLIIVEPKKPETEGVLLYAIANVGSKQQTKAEVVPDGDGYELKVYFSAMFADAWADLDLNPETWSDAKRNLKRLFFNLQRLMGGGLLTILDKSL